jgi:hypothetical protein
VVVVNNPLDNLSEASVSFHEQEVITLTDGTRIIKELGPIVGVFTPGQTFEILNPVDNSVVGLMSHEQLYATLYSLYIKLATERDNAETVQPD